MSQLSDVQLEWAATFTSIPKGALVAGVGGAGASRQPAPDGKLPSPMLPDCDPVHGKVPGPANHLLCAKHHHVVDVEAKTIIAHSLAEYVKAHPANGKGAPSKAGHSASPVEPPAGAGSKTAAPPSATTVAPIAGTPPDVRSTEVPRTKIPTFTGSSKEVFAQTCALLDTFKPSKGHPDMYAALLDGQEVSIAKAQADSIVAQVSKQMQDLIRTIAQSNHSIMQTYEQASAKGMEHIGAGANKLVSFFKGDGWIHDPGSDLELLEKEWRFALSTAGNDIKIRQFRAAAEWTADGEIKGAQAEHLFRVFESKVQKNADTTLSVLKHIESASKTIAKTIATAEFGKAGAAAIDTAFAGAEVAGEALAGHTIDWAGRVIDLGMDVLSDKFSDQAEAAVKERVKGLVEEKLKRFGKEKAKKIAEKIAEKIAKKAVDKGSDMLRAELHAAAKKENKSTTATYSDLAKAAVESISSKPAAETTQKFEDEIDADPEVAALIGGGPG